MEHSGENPGNPQGGRSANGEQEKVTAAPLSAEFLGGSIEAGLEKIRTRLLDLTNRNRLLNFRHTTTSSLRVVDVNLDAVFRRLIENERLPFVPVPDPDIEPKADDNDDSTTSSLKPSASDYAREIGWSISFELESAENTGNSSTLPVLHYLEGLETLTRKIGSTAKTAIEESGTNMLYVVLGFLEWYEADDSQQARLAPLLTVPVALDRAGGKGKGFECTIEYSGEDFTTNLSLAEKMRRDFGIEIPSIEEDDTPETYFARFAAILKQKPRWRIRRQMTLSLLSFGKLLMYRDLDPRAWPGIANHALVKELFEGKKSDTIEHAEELPIDAPELQKDVPPLILDADSSQHSALIHALRGQNLVIEGPPGTGKSQTITNLIAAALTNGKTVLFVSEKLAALEVVRRRLDEAGLGVFCLELHSHKTKKHALLNDLVARLKARGSFRDPRDLDHHLSVVEDKKKLLTHYVTLVNTPIGALQATIFEVVWARDRYYQELLFPRELVAQLLMPVVLSFTRGQFAEAEQFLSVYRDHLAGVQQVRLERGSHPWEWVGKGLSFEEEILLVDLLTEFCDTIRETNHLRQSLTEVAGLTVEESIHGAGTARRFLDALQEPDDAVNASLVASCRDIRTRERLRGFVRDCEEAREFLASLRKASAEGRPEGLLQEDWVRSVSLAVAGLTALGMGKQNVSELRSVLEAMRAAEAALGQAERCFAGLQVLLGSQLSFTAPAVAWVSHCIRLIEDAPVSVLHLRMESFESDGVSQTVRNAAAEARKLSERHQELNVTFDLSVSVETIDARTLSGHAAVIEEASIWRVWFGRDYRRATRGYRRIARKRRNESREQMTKHLKELVDYCQRYTQFENESQYRAILGTHFRGAETHWEGILPLLDWYDEVFASLPEEASVFRDLLLRTRSERLKSLKSALTGAKNQRADLELVESAVPAVVELLSVRASSSDSLQELLDKVRRAGDQIGEALAILSSGNLRDDLPIAQISVVLESAVGYQVCLERIASNPSALELLDSSFRDIETNLDPIKATVVFVESVLSGAFPEETFRWILCDDCMPRVQRLRGHLTQTRSCADKLADVGEQIGTLTASTIWPVNDHEPLPVLLGRAERALASREELPRWLHYVRIRATSQERGLDRLTRLADERVLEPQHLVPAFRFVFYNSLSRAVFAEHSDLSQFSGVTHEQVRSQYAQADKNAIRLFRERAASVIDRRAIPFGNQSGPVGSWTELALITKEINKQKRHIPIRQLVRRASGALQGLKPCFMMGPLSVAQYLAPGQLHFDLIVMDEASQLKPEDAIGAIGRGAQIVIVGDPKQLPPTNFFQRVSNDPDDEDDDDSRAVVEEGESILDVASTLYQPVRRLRWHYRSRHQSLIAFSNHEFYGDLIIFPSAFHEDPSLGIKYHPISGGAFENGRNPREAAVVVDAVLSHMKDHPEESLGVVTLNFEQRELVEELLDQRLRADPLLRRIRNG